MAKKESFWQRYMRRMREEAEQEIEQYFDRLK